VLSGLLGWEPDAPRAQARLAPQLPPTWDRVTVHHLRVGPSDLTTELTRAAGHATVTLSATAPLGVDFVQALPAGARDAHVLLDGKSLTAPAQNGVHDQTLTAHVQVGSRPQRLDFTWTGGLEVDPPHVALRPGQESAGLRVLDFRPASTGWTLVVEGTAARRYEIRLVGERVARADGAEVINRQEDLTTLAVTFPAGPPRQTQTITLSR